ncbi:SDR family oxidoreductase [Pseudoduganella danionis]|uniref:Sugar nucleotide-binding protein n=1 Tax=Pseudoduganella danionis TaxID=1890295 RepID=A0ABW9SMK6_9BURK|nr:SDR family oxidoreductase [Pseudoduganella danionis]MTW33220.1 sugar nucleotide-binding protein [Pseudoduganella danionis]
MNKISLQKFRRPRLLIIGCGDVGMRMLPLLTPYFRVFAVTSQPARCAELRARGAQPLVANLDQPATLRRLRGLAHTVLHLAPPAAQGGQDVRTRHLTAILPERAQVVYVSTTGVYGDCGGARFDETRAVAPATARAQRRVDAEQMLRQWARHACGQLSILRVPGIYAADRLPLARLQAGTPALCAAEDVHTNHIHADDLARIVVAALFRARPQRIYHAVDDSAMKMGEYFDAVADAYGLARPPRLSRAELRQVVTPALLSFMSESRQLENRRLRRELGMRLRYPTVQAFLQQARTAA